MPAQRFKVGDEYIVPELVGFPGSGGELRIVAVTGELLAYRYHGEVNWIEMSDWEIHFQNAKRSLTERKEDKS